MPTLRSREIPFSPPQPPKSKSKPKTLTTPQTLTLTLTPNSTTTTTQSPPSIPSSSNPNHSLSPSRRRSPRLASMDGGAGSAGSTGSGRNRRRRDDDGSESKKSDDVKQEIDLGNWTGALDRGVSVRGGESSGVVLDRGKGILVQGDDDEGSGELGQRVPHPFDLNAPAGDSVQLDADVNMIDEAEVVVGQAVGSVAVNAARDDSALWQYNYKRTREAWKSAAQKSAESFAHYRHEKGAGPSNPEKIDEAAGRFDEARKRVQERGKKGKNQDMMYAVDRDGVVSVKWTPVAREDCGRPVHSLQDLCLDVLKKNADAIDSLLLIPNVFKHKLSRMLTDSKKMNTGFFDLLAQNAPFEIRLYDCSWMSEEEFQGSLEGCDTKNLTVIQLDQCGRCMPDYILSGTLARKGLPALTAISLKGGFRITDAGLKALVSAAPVLSSVNLSQCSLLTTAGIYSMVDSLSSTISELYLDGCETLDVILILPALIKLKHLQVLSLKGNPSVHDQFVRELVTAIGHQMKELIFADCVNLTDASMKVIGENCSKLRALDISNVCHVMDVGIGYIANGLEAVKSLAFSRQEFSDEAVAALIETCGTSLKELSLNNLKKISHQTAVSISKCCKDLETLDISFCRSLTEEAIGLIADHCSSLKMLKLFGCTQVTKVFLNSYSNRSLKLTGPKLTPILEGLKDPNPVFAPLRYPLEP
ncbi:F-box and leucine-rich repeat protein 13-like protein [Drosera capensis]